MWVRECVYVDENRYIHQLTKIERTKQTNKTLRKGPLKVVNINCYVLQAEMFASLCLRTKHIFPIGHMPRVKRRTKSHLIRPWNRGKSDVPVAPSRKQFYLFTFFRCHIKAKNNYFINRFILESESITITRLILLFRNVKACKYLHWQNLQPASRYKDSCSELSKTTVHLTSSLQARMTLRTIRAKNTHLGLKSYLTTWNY